MISEIASGATALALVVGAASLFAQSRARRFGLAQVYIQRYWEIDDRLIEGDGLGADVPATRRYLRLCEDEFDVAHQGWIDFGVWRIWHEGIRLQAGDPTLDVSDYQSLGRCIRQGHHSPNHCEGLGEAGLRRKFRWWFESALGG